MKARAPSPVVSIASLRCECGSAEAVAPGADASPTNYSGGLIRRTVRPDSQREPLPN